MSISEHLARVLVVASVGCLAAAEWVVPDSPLAVALTCQAVVDIDRGATVLVLPTSKDLVAAWVIAPGTRVRRGDPLIVFDPTIPLGRLSQRRDDLAIAAAEEASRLAYLAAEQTGAIAERDRLAADLGVAVAALDLARRPDPERLMLLAAEVEAARLAVAVEGRRSREIERAATAGERSQQDLDDAQVAATTARRRLAAAEAELAKGQSASSAMTVRQRELTVARLRDQLGVDAAGVPIAGSGQHGRIQDLEARGRREQRQATERREESERWLHEAERDATDHAPLQQLVFSGSLTRTFVCGPHTAPAAEASVRLSDQPYTPERGCGVLTGTAMALARHSKHGDAALLLATGEVELRIDLPDGAYELAATFGDVFDWDGAVLRIRDADGERCLLAERRIEARRNLVTQHPVRISDGHCVIVLGDRRGKALRAPDDGIALPREWIRPGWKPGWLKDPAAFLAGPGSLCLRARLPREQARLLRVAGTPAATDLAGRLSVDHGSVQLPDGRILAVTVSALAMQPMALALRADASGDGALDRIACEARFTVEPAAAALLYPGQELPLRLPLTLGSGLVAVPAGFAVESDGRWWVQPAGEALRTVAAVATDEAVVIDLLLAPGASLERPQPQSATHARRVAGIIVPDQAPVLVPSLAGGRIASLLPDGSDVTAGQVVVTLYNPWIEDRKDESERSRARARDAYAEAAETRRVATQRAAAAGRDQALAEAQARTARDAVAERDLVREASAIIDAEAAATAEAAAFDRLRRARALGEPAQISDAEAAAERASRAALSADLERIATLRALDWPALRSADADWRDAVNEMVSRELDQLLARSQEKANALSAELKLAEALRGSWWEQRFQQGRELKSPAAGRVTYREGWDDRLNRSGRFERDFWVWRGMTVADIVDLSRLAVDADLPETVSGLRVGMTIGIWLPRLGRRLDATLTRVADAATTPREADPSTEGVLALRRVVRVTAAFAVPDDLRGIITPGGEAEVELP